MDSRHCDRSMNTNLHFIDRSNVPLFTAKLSPTWEPETIFGEFSKFTSTSVKSSRSSRKQLKIQQFHKSKMTILASLDSSNVPKSFPKVPFKPDPSLIFGDFSKLRHFREQLSTTSDQLNLNRLTQVLDNSRAAVVPDSQEPEQLVAVRPRPK